MEAFVKAVDEKPLAEDKIQKVVKALSDFPEPAHLVGVREAAIAKLAEKNAVGSGMRWASEADVHAGAAGRRRTG